MAATRALVGRWEEAGTTYASSITLTPTVPSTPQSLSTRSIGSPKLTGRLSSDKTLVGEIQVVFSSPGPSRILTFTSYQHHGSYATI